MSVRDVVPPPVGSAGAELPALSEDERKIYERQIQLPELGEEGQRRLKAASVLVSRVGGLGGTVAMLLARAGIGRLVLAHDGVIEHENLNRMHLAFRDDLGRTRVDAFRDTLGRINPDLEVITEPHNVNAGNVRRLMDQADLVVDGAPLFEERFVMNAEAVRQGKPLVMAAMFALEGYVSTFRPGVTPCLHCLYPQPPDYWNVKVFPVIAPSSVLVATLAAMEAIKLIADFGDRLEGQMLYFDLGSYVFRKLTVERRADCEVCSAVAVPA